jgi:probable F420-dependent oxidoreductase
VKLDIALFEAAPAAAAARAREYEEQGFDGVFTFDGPHDPFLPLVAVANETERVTLGTAVAIAFGRNPMICAQTANDLQLASKGRFVLGLGTQVRAHVERRYGQAFARPHARMREFVDAIRAIWRCWNEGVPLHFRGEFYTHTLMPPLFNPGVNPHGPPPVWLGGVGARMVTVAGEVADGWLVHPFHTPSYVREVAAPALTSGLARRGRARNDVTIACQTIVALADDASGLAKARASARAQIAFYATTPAYKAVLDHHGWGGLQVELATLAREGSWAQLAGRVDDEVLDAIVVSARPEELREKLRARNGFADRTMVVLYNEAGPDARTRIG